MKKKKYLNQKSIFNPLIEFLNHRNLLPAILFVFSRKKCQDFAESINVSLVDHLERKEIEKTFDYYISKLVNTNENIEQIDTVKRLAMKGIGYHHSGMLPPLKEIIEVLFGYKDNEGKPKPLIKVLFATETFAVGVNMPAKTTVFSDLNKFDNTNGMRNLYSHEYTQMAGRAGRRGLDKLGNVIYYPIREIEPLHCIKHIVINKPEALISKFLINVKFIMKGIKSKDQEIIKILEKSLMNNENNKRKIFLEKNIKEIEEKIESQQKNLSYYNQKELDIVYSYIEATERMNNLNGKQRKKFYKEFNTKKQDYEFCKQGQNIFNLIESLKQSKNLLNENNQNINYLQTSNIKEMEKIIEFLKKYEYIENNPEINVQNIKYENINLKGIITSEFNESNELLMTELIQKGVFKDINQMELLSILSIFCDDFDKENEYYIDDLVVSDNCKLKFKKIKEIHNELLNFTDQYSIQYDPGISLQFADIVWLWCNNKSFTEIIKEYEIFEGNFIKNMQKIHNIVNELNTVAEILEDHDLLTKIQNIESLIIKDIVDAKSLYLI